MTRRVAVARKEGGPFPAATYTLIAAQIAVWLAVRQYLLPGSDWTDFALRPDVPSELGFLVSPFVHLDPAHLGINLAVLWLFGTNLERALGSLRFLALYLGAAWFAALMQWATFISFHLSPDLTTRNAAVGSSGAIAGVLGAFLVRFPQARLRIPFGAGLTFPAAPVLGLWLAYTVIRALVTTVSGVSEGIGHWAHFGGFIFGLGVAQALGLQRQARVEFLIRTARTALAADNLPVAAQAWSALLALRPADLQVRLSLISARLRMGDQPGARRLAREGVENLVRNNERTLCLEAYREYQQCVPDMDLPRGIRYRIGCWLAEAGEDELAYRALLESVREDGLTPAAASALYHAGQLACERLRSPLHAREAWERLVEQFPDSPWSDAARDALHRLPAVR